MGHDTTSQDLRSLRMPMVGTLGVAFLALVAVVLTFNRSDRADTERDTEVAAGPDSTTVGATDDPGAEEPDDQPDQAHTGFYVPGDLPEGWTVRFGTVTNPFPERCPCTTATWRGEEGARLTADTSSARDPIDPPDHPAAIGEEPGSVTRTIPGGYLREDLDGVFARWFDGEVTRGIHGQGVDPEVVVDLAASWTGGGPLTPPAGFEPVWSTTTGRIEWRTEVNWIITDPEGRSMVVHLEPWWMDDAPDLAAFYPDTAVVTLPGNGLDLVQEPGWSEPHLSGIWPGGAWVSVGESHGELNYTGPYLAREQMLDVAGSFRPATAEEWEAHADEHLGPEAAEACRPLLGRARLTDLLVRSGDPSVDPHRDACHHADVVGPAAD